MPTNNRRRIIITALCSALLLLLPATTTTTTHAQTNVCEPPATGAPIIFDGSGLTQTAPFTLEGGAYTLDWSVTPQKYVSMNLVSVDDTIGFGDLLVNTSTLAGGRTHVYAVKRGTYYLKVSTQSKWTATLTPS